MTQQNHGSSYGSELATHKKVQQHTMNGAGGCHSHAHHGPDHLRTAEKETVDAGLASLDHCTFPKPHVPPPTQVFGYPKLFANTVLLNRPTTATAMALLASCTATSARAVGDALPRLHAG